jgi:hypothetical protein
MTKRRQSGRWSAFVDSVTAKVKRLYEEMKAASKGEATRKKTGPVNGWVSGSGEELRSVPCKFRGVHVEAVLDSGADQSVMCPRLVEKLEAVGIWMTSRALGKEVELAGFQEGLRVYIARDPLLDFSQQHILDLRNLIKVDLDFSTFAGKLLLRNVVCWVAAAPLAAGLGEILVRRREMAVMGYSAELILDKARAENVEYDMVGDHPVKIPAVALLSLLEQPPARPIAEEEASFIPLEEAVCFPMDKGNVDKIAEVKDVLLRKVQEVEDAGGSPIFTTQLRDLLLRYADVFRLELGRDPPVDMPPQRVKLRDDAKPVRCNARRYGPEQRVFTDSHVEQLEKAGRVYKNTRSRWCSPPLIVRKPEVSAFRMTVDVRVVNAQTERMVWPMSMLKVSWIIWRGLSVFLIGLF